ncbi:MAG: hypothetical protein KKG59_07145 [Nanoarchaeota archaeon]|nr:hypothetical protein [Nanoarchaeota archaeon]
MPELRDIVLDDLKRKRTPEEIRKGLLRLGYRIEDIEKAIASAEKMYGNARPNSLLTVGRLSDRDIDQDVELLENEVLSHDYDIKPEEKKGPNFQILSIMLLIVFIWLGIAFAFIWAPNIDFDKLKDMVIDDDQYDDDFLKYCKEEMANYEMYTEDELDTLCKSSDPIARIQYVENTDTRKICQKVAFDTEENKKCGRQLYYIIDEYIRSQATS